MLGAMWRAARLIGAICYTAMNLAGCGDNTYNRLTDQDVVTSLVWNGVYGHDTPPPPVLWHTKLIPCSIGLCAGIWHTGNDFAEVVKTEAFPFHKSALAHEYMHAHLQASYGDADPKHARVEWGTVRRCGDAVCVPEVWGLLNDAVLALWKAGY